MAFRLLKITVNYSQLSALIENEILSEIINCFVLWLKQENATLATRFFSLIKRMYTNYYATIALI